MKTVNLLLSAKEMRPLEQPGSYFQALSLIHEAVKFLLIPGDEEALNIWVNFIQRGWLWQICGMEAVQAVDGYKCVLHLHTCTAALSNSDVFQIDWNYK